MKRMYAMIGERSGELLTYRGKILVHWDPDELEFLFNGVEIIELQEIPFSYMHISEHPDVKGVIQFPIDRSQFRDSFPERIIN